MIKFLKFCCSLVCLSFCWMALHDTPLRGASLPNIVLILADDLGYGDVQSLNPNSKIKTPALDDLARHGMKFTDAHSASAVCTPTRYAIITGRYCWRTRLKRGVLNGYSKPLIDKNRRTFASVAKQKGYSTGIVGKWHLGLGFVEDGEKQINFRTPLTSTPNDNGFDYSYIIPASLDFPPYVYIENRSVVGANEVNQPAQKFPAFLRRGPRSTELKMEECLDHLTEKATEFITTRAQTKSPFLLYFPLTAPHKPVLPHPRFRGATKLGPYGDFIVQVDHTVGKVLSAIDEAGIRENTLVIFTSDNGSFMHKRPGKDHVDDETIQAYDPNHHQANSHWRGTKADVWEAGHRVPFFARWPNIIKSGTECTETICSVDFLATVANVMDFEKPKSAIDSFSWLPLFRGKSWQREPVINHSAAGMFAIRSGKWKLVLGNGSGGRQAPKGKPFQKPYALFDLSVDISESNNILESHLQVAQDLESQLDKIRGNSR